MATNRAKDFLYGAAIVGVALAVTIGPAAAAPNWDDIVKAANAEGEVDVHGGPGELYQQVLTEGFRRAYPRIKINFSGLSGRDAIPKIVREREAGIYNWDVYVGGTFSTLQSLKPAGAIAPLRPALILPEVTDDKAWYGGLDGAWVDKDKAYTFAFEAMLTPVMLVNWDFVSRDDLKSYDDLLNPQFAGKIVWDDPRYPGQGVAGAQRLLINFGADFLKRLFTEQKIVYTTNIRQAGEWLVSGKYPIGISSTTDEIDPFLRQGLGKNISAPDLPLAHPTVEYGFGTVSLMDRAPHRNAATVYVNWLLSKAGQADWLKTGENSRRLDVPHAAPDLFPKPGVVYIADQAEENVGMRAEAANLAKQYIGGQP